LQNIRRPFYDCLALGFVAGSFSSGANATATIECDGSARLFDYSRDHRVEFSDGDDFLP
jgi:hypothetical protein